MRILHVIRGLANSSGTTHIVVPLSEAQARAGAEVTVFHVRKPGETAVDPDAEWVNSRCFDLSLPFDNPGISVPFYRSLRKSVPRFDVVHIHAIWNFPTWMAMRTASRAGVPYVVAPQGSLDPWAMVQNRWRKMLYAKAVELPLMQRAAGLQALTEKEADQIRASGLKAPVHILPNGVNPAAYAGSAPPLARRLGLPEGQRTLLFLSRVDPKKGLDLLVDAFDRLARHRSDITLVLAGHDGGTGYRDTVAGWIRDRGLEDRCRWLGEVRGQEKCETLLGADAFVLPSYSEGLPVAVLEAMASALPVVVSRECNISEVETHEAGWVTGVDSESVTAALEALFDNADQAHTRGQNGRRLVSAQFSWSSVAARSLELYRACGAVAGEARTGSKRANAA